MMRLGNAPDRAVTPEIQCLADLPALYSAAAAVIERAAAKAVRTDGAFTVALSGGSTPKGLYTFLAEDPRPRSNVPWDAARFFWSDERHVPPDHSESNYRMAYDAMLSKVPVRPERVHRVRAEHPDPVVAADEYETAIRAWVGSEARMPRFDLILLGLGADGHTASLFPGTQALSEQRRLVTANWVERLDAYRITMTLGLLNAAREVMFVVAGEEKAQAVRDVLQPRLPAPRLPAQLVQPANGRLRWLIDREAARLLKGKSQ
jgi:6-phosphogluconolactonase